MLEAQLEFIAGALRAFRRDRLDSLEVREEAQAAFVREMDEALEGSVFLVGGCTSYYLDKTGRVALAWPWTMATLRRRLREFDLAAFDTRVGGTSGQQLGGAAAAAAVAAAARN
jgi:cyclohexanone monooxygenase